MADEQAKVPLVWREFIITVPKSLGDLLDKAMAKQREFEDREIQNSEYFCWLLMLGLEQVTRLNEAAKKADARIIEPGSNGLKVPGVVDIKL